MAQEKLESMYSQMFTAPVRASLLAEKEYRKIWLENLEKLKQKLGSDEEDEPAVGEGGDEDGDNNDGNSLIKLALDMAPVMSFDAHISAEIIMRIVSIESKSGELGLQVGAFKASGRYGSENTQESTFKASAHYRLSNSHHISLDDYLQSHGINLTKKPDEIEKAIETLKEENED